MIQSPQPAPELVIDAGGEISRITSALENQLASFPGRRGLIVVLSPTTECLLCAALAVRAVGAEHVLGLSLPDRESRQEDRPLARHWAEALGIELVVEDMTRALEALGCYSRRDAAIRLLIPDFADGWQWSLRIRHEPTGSERLWFHQLVARSPQGEKRVVRVPASEHQAIAAASAFKERVRAMMAYYYADLRQSAVIGCLSRHRYDQGTFVKGGDGLADVEPVAHLYASQVQQLAAALLPDAELPPLPTTTDVPLDVPVHDEAHPGLGEDAFDVVLNAFNRGVHHSVTAARLGVSPEQVARFYRDIARRREATRYLHAPPLLSQRVPEIPGILADVDRRQG